MGLDLLDIEFKFKRDFRVRFPGMGRSAGPGSAAMLQRWRSRQPVDMTAGELLEFFLMRVGEAASSAACRGCGSSLPPALWCGPCRANSARPAQDDRCPACGAAAAHLTSVDAAWPEFSKILVDCLAVDPHEVRQGAWLIRELGMA